MEMDHTLSSFLAILPVVWWQTWVWQWWDDSLGTGQTEWCEHLVPDITSLQPAMYDVLMKQWMNETRKSLEEKNAPQIAFV